MRVSIDCTGKTVVAGFWNSHVHFTQAVWKNAASAPAAPLEEHMQEMLTRWGFTSVWDLGSDPRNSLPSASASIPAKCRVRIFSLPADIFPKGGHPVYLPAELQLPEAATSDEATQMSRNYLEMGLDGIKLFTGAYMGDKPVVNMDVAIARAAVEVAHAQGKPVFAHPQNRTGLETVIEAGVDVMAHITPGEPGYSAEQLARFQIAGDRIDSDAFSVCENDRRGRVVCPAGRFRRQSAQGIFRQRQPRAVWDRRRLHHIYDTSIEYELMHRALSERQILASLTTNPALYFKAAKKGKVEKGFDADLVVLDGDPVADLRNLAKVAYTIRAGEVIYRKP